MTQKRKPLKAKAEMEEKSKCLLYVKSSLAEVIFMKRLLSGRPGSTFRSLARADKRAMNCRCRNNGTRINTPSDQLFKLTPYHLQVQSLPKGRYIQTKLKPLNSQIFELLGNEKYVSKIIY